MATVVLHPRLVAAACMDPPLAYMIQNGLPLTRERWMNSRQRER